MEEAEEDEDEEPLHWVSCNETEEDIARMGRLLARNPDCLNAREPDATPLFRAVSYGHSECVAFLLQAGADPDIDMPTSSLHISIFGDISTDITRMLLLSGASANATKHSNRCVYIVSASRIRAIETVRLLLDYGAMTEDLQYLQSLKENPVAPFCFLLDTPLAVAALEGDHSLFRLLLERGALPIISAAQHGVARAVQDVHNVARLILQDSSVGLFTKRRLLRTFHLFGGDPMQRLRNGDTPFTKLSENNEANELKELAERLSHNVRSLKELSRLRILRAIGRDYMTRVQVLRANLPRTLADFLEFPEQ